MPYGVNALNYAVLAIGNPLELSSCGGSGRVCQKTGLTKITWCPLLPYVQGVRDPLVNFTAARRQTAMLCLARLLKLFDNFIESRWPSGRVTTVYERLGSIPRPCEVLLGVSVREFPVVVCATVLGIIVGKPVYQRGPQDI